MYVSCGVDFDKFDAAKAEIEAQLDAIRRGEVSADELCAAKRSCAADLLAVALKEANEESGVMARPVLRDIFSVEILGVPGHVKRGKYVSSHLHLNVTYLLEADEEQTLHEKPDENSGVRWFALRDVIPNTREPEMRVVYQKLMDKCDKLP